MTNFFVSLWREDHTHSAVGKVLIEPSPVGNLETGTVVALVNGMHQQYPPQDIVEC